MWDHETPIFLDFETQSAADIKETGGRQYAYHPSTRILMLAFCWPRVNSATGEHAYEYGLWIPDYIRVDTRSWSTGYATCSLWPFEIKPSQQVTLHRGKLPPDILFDRIKSGCPVVAHNAYMFDRYIWDRFIGAPAVWLDSLMLAKASGRPGKLDTLGKTLLGHGKDRAASLMPKLCTGVTPARDDWFKSSADDDLFNPVPVSSGWSYPYIQPGELQAFSRYAIGDVEILRRLWVEEFAHLEVEADVIEMNDRVNRRGVKVDVKLLQGIEQLSTYSVDRAKDEIAEICGPELNIRSTQQMHEWLDSYGIKIVDDNGKLCLRKEIVQRYLDSPYLIDEHIHASREIPPVVLDVLRLRQKAIRITGAKVERALERVMENDRVYDLHTYHTAHTGRASSMGLQIHNLPRPLKGVDTRVIIDMIHEWNGGNIETLFDRIKSVLPKGITIDDVCSTLLRPALLAKEGHVFGICDYSQVESRCLAWVAQEGKLLEAFRDERDVYKEFGAKMYGCTPQEIVDVKRDVSKVIVLASGYGMGPDKLRVYAANAGVDLNAAGITAEMGIAAFRDTYTNICGFRPDKEKSFRTNGIWHKLDKAIMECVGSGITTAAGKCVFKMERGDLVCILPSGRKMYYPSAQIKDVVPGYCYTLGLPLVPKATVVYQSARGEKSLYGGIETENVCQAIPRDILMIACVKLDAESLNPVMHVHDETVCEFPEFDPIKSLHRQIAIMSDVPAWADGFPVACEGFTSPRFLKKPWSGYYAGGTHTPVHAT